MISSLRTIGNLMQWIPATAIVQQRFDGERIWDDQALCTLDMQCYEACLLHVCMGHESIRLHPVCVAGSLGPLCSSRVASSSNTAAQVTLPEGCQGMQIQLENVGGICSLSHQRQAGATVPVAPVVGLPLIFRKLSVVLLLEHTYSICVY